MYRIVMVSSLLAACGGGVSDTGTAVDYARTVVTDLGQWTVTVDSDPDPIPPNDLFSLDVTVAGEGVSGELFVEVDASMPQHNHGMNTQPETTWVDGERWRTEGMLFHMTGDWRITVAIDDGETYERAFIWVDCCEPPA